MKLKTVVIQCTAETLRCLETDGNGSVRLSWVFFFFQAEDGIRDYKVTGVQTCALPICPNPRRPRPDQAAGPARGVFYPERAGLIAPTSAIARPAGVRRAGQSVIGARQIGRASCRERV